MYDGLSLEALLSMASSSGFQSGAKSKVVWMQFTGFTDKNGVEIYEGDLIKWGHVDGYDEHKPREAVVKMEPALCFETFNLGEHNHTFHYGNFAYARSIDKAMEVIGNIYQNPELLES